MGVEFSKRLLAINSASALLTRVIRATVLVWLYQYLLRRISPDEFAVYALVSALMVFAPILSSFFTSGVSRYVVEACAQGRERQVTRIISSLVPVLAAWGVLFVTLGWTVAWNIEALFTVASDHVTDARLMLAMLVADFAIQMVLAPLAVGFHVRQRYTLLNAIEICTELFRLALLFTLFKSLTTGVLWLVVATVVSSVSSVAVRTFVSTRLLPALHLERNLFHWPTARQLFSFGIWTTLNHVASLMHVNGDVLILNKLATAVDVAVFKLGADFYSQINTLVVSGIVPLQPVLTSLHARGERARMAEAVLRTAKYIFWFSLLIVLPVTIYRRELIELYAGTTYLDAAPVVALLLMLFLFMPAGFLLAPVSAAMAQMRGFALANLIIQVVKLAVTLYAVRVLGLGALGCALSTLVVVGLAHTFVLGPMALNLSGVSVRQYATEIARRGCPPALVGVTVWSVLHWFAPPSTWLALGISTVIGGIAYVLTLALFCLNPKERNDIGALRDRFAVAANRGSRRLVAWATR